MCFGVYHDGWSVNVTDGVAKIAYEGEERLSIDVVTLARLYREGMAQHRREKANSPEALAVALAAQWEDLCEKPPAPLPSFDLYQSWRQ